MLLLNAVSLNGGGSGSSLTLAAGLAASSPGRHRFAMFAEAGLLRLDLNKIRLCGVVLCLCCVVLCCVCVVLCCAVLCGAVFVLCCVVLGCVVLCCAVPVLCCVCAVWCCVVLCCVVLCGAVLCCVVLVLKSIDPPINNCGPPNFYEGGGALIGAWEALRHPRWP